MRSKTRGKPPAPYRSWFEHEIAKELKGSRAKYEPITISYLKAHTYKPDWVLPNGIIIEAKGRFTSVDRAKHLLVKKQNPSLDIRFIFKYDNKLYKQSKTRYSDWCKKYGFEYDFDKVPKKWIAERKVMRKNKKIVAGKINVLAPGEWIQVTEKQFIKATNKKKKKDGI